MAAPRALQNPLGVQELAHGSAGLGPAREPVPDALLIQRHGRGLGLGVVVAHGLDHAAVAFRMLIGDHHPPDGVLAVADAGQSESYCHAPEEVSGPRDPLRPSASSPDPRRPTGSPPDPGLGTRTAG